MCFFSLLKYSLVMTIWASWLLLMYTDARTHRIHRHASFFFCLKETKTTQPPQLRLKGNCSGDKLFWMVKVLPVRTQGPASARTPWPWRPPGPPGAWLPELRGILLFPVLAAVPMVQRAGRQAALTPSPSRRSSSTPCRLLFLLLPFVSFRPDPGIPALLPSLPSRVCRRKGSPCAGVAAGLGLLHGMGKGQALPRDSVSRWVWEVGRGL